MSAGWASRRRLRRLIGQGLRPADDLRFLNHELRRRLTPGGYTVIIDGFIKQPRRCGRKQREQVLRFR